MYDVILRFLENAHVISGRTACLRTHRAHQGVEHADSEGGATGKGLSEVQLCVWVVIIILVQELNI